MCLSILPTSGAHVSAAEPADPVHRHAITAPLATRSLLLDGDAVGDFMVVVGERGHILVSADAGLTWSQSEVPTRATLTGVSLHDRSRGWAVGHDAVVLRTEDGGLSWKTVHAAPEEERPLLDVWFENAEHGIAVGAYGYFLETRDGGETWQSRRINDDDLHLNQIAAASPERLYIAAEAGRVYRSDDGGAHWTVLPSPYEGSFFGTLPLDSRRVYLYGLRGHLFQSDDAGAHWRRVETGTQSMLTSGFALGDDAIAFTGMGGTLLVDHGGARALIAYQRRDREGIAGALPATDGVLVVFGAFGVERTSVDLLAPLQ